MMGGLDQPLDRFASFGKPAARAEAVDSCTADQQTFIRINMIACLFLQRFGLILGRSELYLCFFIFLASAVWILVRKGAALQVKTTILYLIVATSFTLSSVIGFMFPRFTLVDGLSVASLIGVLTFNAVFLLWPVPSSLRDFSLTYYTKLIRIICVIGIIQYFAQFIDIRVFTLGEVFPILRPILLEDHYNTVGIVEWGSTIQRANGVFLIEPGAFSQVIAIGILIDAFILKRFVFLPLYAFAYALSYSGTGALSLLLTLAISVIFLSGYRKYVLAGVGVGLVVLAILPFVVPETSQTIGRRLAEFSTPGASAYVRYMAQAQAWSYFSNGWRLLIGTGPGAFERTPFFVQGSTSAAIKLFAEYGLLGLIAFATFLVNAVWNHRVPLLSLMMLVVFQFGGGNLLQPPVLTIIALLCVWTQTAPPVRIPDRRP